MPKAGVFLTRLAFYIMFRHIVGAFVIVVTVLKLSSATLEGQPCGIVDAADNHTSTCTLAYTRCNEKTNRCECDTTAAVGMKLPGYTDIVDCIPLDYVRTTERCLPTTPDICSVLVPGAYCDAELPKTSGSMMKCKCQIGGVYPNCTTRIGSTCRTSDTCAKDIPNSFCGGVVDGLGKCMCGELADGRNYVGSTFGDTCLPINCAARPCYGDPTAATCVDVKHGFECKCNNGSKGHSHSPSTRGICCNSDRIPCSDFKKCIPVEAICNGKSDCEDCSDEKQTFCMGSPPSDNLQCASIQERDPSANKELSGTLVSNSFVPTNTRKLTATNTVFQPNPAQLFASPVMSIPLGRGLTSGW